MGNMQISEMMVANHNSSVLSKINDFRISQKFCDVTVVVEGVEFPAHKAILAGFNPYFESLFTGGFAESHQEKIELESFDLSIMESLLDYIYTGAIEITSDNVQYLLHTANFLQDELLLLLCCNYLENNINSTSCIDILNISEVYSQTELHEKARQFILENFSNVCTEVGFLELGSDKVIDLISDSGLRADKEEHVFDAVLQWFHYKPVERETILPDVIKHVRLTKLDPYFLHTRLNTTKVLLKSESCMKLFLDVFSYHTLPNRRNELQQPSASRQHDTTSDVEVLLITVQSKQHPCLPVKHLCVTEDGAFVRTFEFPPIDDMNTLSTTSGNELFFVDPKIKKVKVYNTDARGWVSLDSFLVPVGKALLNLDGRWCAFRSSESQSCVVFLDETSRRWRSPPPMPELVHNPGIVSVDGMIYFVGGNTTTGTRSRRIQRYDPFTEMWSLASTLPAPWKTIKVCALNGFIYVYNSPDDSEYETWQLDAYSVRSNQWNACSKMSEQLKHHIVLKTIAFRGNIYVLLEKDSVIDIVIYSPTKDSWCDFSAFSQTEFKIATMRGPMIVNRSS